MSHIGTYKMLGLDLNKVNVDLLKVAYENACKECGLEYSAMKNKIFTPSGHDWKVNLATMTITGDVFWDGKEYNELKAKLPEWYFALGVAAHEQVQGNKTHIERVKGELLVLAEA